MTSKAVAADTVKANTVHAKTVQLGDSTGTNTTVTADGIAVTTKNPDGTTSKVEIKKWYSIWFNKIRSGVQLK